ncbi:MAG: ABC transporter ATP-binding protein [Clostridium beijerinckii]|nr:ABC transporter ATP-binding protein [Clostridium beijerinckii]
MDLEEKYKDIIEAYTRTTKENDEFDDVNYSHKKSKFKSNFDYGDFSKENRKLNKRNKSKNWS